MTLLDQDRPQPHNGPEGGMSPAVAAAMARLEAMRAARGIVPRPPADAGQLDQGAAVDLANWSIRNAQKLLQAKRARPGRGWASQDGPGRAESGAAGESIAVPAESGPQGRPEPAGGQIPTEDRQCRQDKTE